MTHDQLQSKCYQWAYGTYPMIRKLLWHTPNELLKHKWETVTQFRIRLNQRKALGVAAGVLDLVLYWKGVLHVFDIKVGKDRLSDDQLEFIAQVESQGGKAYEIRSLEQFQNIIKQIL